MTIPQRELAEYIHRRMLLLSGASRVCTVSFSDFVNEDLPTVEDVIKVVNWLERKEIIEWLYCDEKEGECDYVNQYRVREWRG